MNIKKITGLVLATVMLLPILVTATVVISYTYPTSTSAAKPYIYLAQGPNYAAANAMGLFYAKQTTTTPANITSGTTIYINYTAGAQTTYLLNVLEIVNNTPAGYPVTVTFTTVSLPAGVTMYYTTSTTGATLSSLGTSVSSGNSISLPQGTSVVYLSFVLGSSTTPATSGSGQIVIQYTVG